MEGKTKRRVYRGQVLMVGEHGGGQGGGDDAKQKDWSRKSEVGKMVCPHQGLLGRANRVVLKRRESRGCLEEKGGGEKSRGRQHGVTGERKGRGEREKCGRGKPNEIDRRISRHQKKKGRGWFY